MAGSLKISAFQFAHQPERLSRFAAVIVDPSGQVIYAAGDQSPTPLESLEDSPLLAAARRAGKKAAFRFDDQNERRRQYRLPGRHRHVATHRLAHFPEAAFLRGLPADGDPLSLCVSLPARRVRPVPAALAHCSVSVSCARWKLSSPRFALCPSIAAACRGCAFRKERRANWPKLSKVSSRWPTACPPPIPSCSRRWPSGNISTWNCKRFWPASTGRSPNAPRNWPPPKTARRRPTAPRASFWPT